MKEEAMVPPGNSSAISGVRDTAIWLPIEEAPRDGSPIWGWLNDSGIRLLVWMTPAECAAYEGSDDPDEYEGGWAEAFDLSEDWSPRWWLPASTIGAPVDAVKFRDAIADTSEGKEIPGGTDQ